MIWYVAAGTVIAAAAALFFVLSTDGRYFGKPFVRWFYDRFGSDIFGTRSEAARWQRLARELDLQGTGRILDVGTAIGDLPLTLASRPGFRGQAIGVDWSPRMVAAARAEAARRQMEALATFQVVDIRQGLPFADDGFDVVFCLGLLEALPQPDGALSEMARVLKPGGQLVVSLYRGWFSRHVALSLAWYEEHLPVHGMGRLRVAPCRGNQDVVISQKEGIA